MYSTPNPLPNGAQLRVVNRNQRISFKGNEYDVAPLKLAVGCTVAVSESQTFEGEVCAFVENNIDTFEVVLRKITKDEWGFDVDAQVIGTKE